MDAEIHEIREKDYDNFKKAFCAYYGELDCEDDPLHLFSEYLLPDLKAGLFNVAVAKCGEDILGFVIFQIDDVINDWCFKDGWGNVRELYVYPEARYKGLGGSLLRYAENALRESGATDVYCIPTEEAETFFTERGYTDSGEVCPDADGKVLTRKLS